MQKTPLRTTAHTAERRGWLSPGFLPSLPLQPLIPHKRPGTAPAGHGAVGSRSAIAKRAAQREQHCFTTLPLISFPQHPPPVHSLCYTMFASSWPSPGQNGSAPTCLVVEMLLNPQQCSYASFPERYIYSSYIFGVYRAVTYHVQPIIHLKQRILQSKRK